MTDRSVIVKSVRLNRLSHSRDLGRLKRQEFEIKSPHSRDAGGARGFVQKALENMEGAGKTGCALHPRSRVQVHVERKRTRAYRFSGSTPAFPAQWF